MSYDNNVTRHEFFCKDLLLNTITNNLSVTCTHLVKRIHCAFSIVILVDTDSGICDKDEEDHQGFDPGWDTVFALVLFYRVSNCR